MDSVRSTRISRTPSILASTGGKTSEPSTMVTRSMAKSLGPRELDENNTPLSSLPASKGEKRKRTVTVKKESGEEKPAVKKSCMLCEDELATVTFYPCRHQACCFDCSLRLKKCPKCKRAISKKEREDGQAIELDKPVSYSELMAKVRELEENQLCSICMARKKSIVFNCGHMACESCMSSLTICHYCRAVIDTRTRIFQN